MRFLMKDENGVHPTEAYSMSMNRQAIAIADCDGRLIPQEGVDYDIKIAFAKDNPGDVSIDIIPLTDKGEFWRDYAMKTLRADPSLVNPPKLSLSDSESVRAGAVHTAVAAGIGKIIPKPEVDYFLEITFTGEYSSNVSMNVVPITERGKIWRDYVMRMIRKYPPTVENPEMSIPEESGGEEAGESSPGEKAEEESSDEKIMS